MRLADINTDSWQTHKWNARHVEIDGRDQLLLSCSLCEREFIEDQQSQERFAAHLSVFHIHRLSDQVTEKWCREICPGKRLKSDDAARRKTGPDPPAFEEKKGLPTGLCCAVPLDGPRETPQTSDMPRSAIIRLAPLTRSRHASAESEP